MGGSVGLIIGSSGDDIFCMGLLRWVSNRLGFKSTVWFLISGLGGRCGGRCWLWFDGLYVCV